MNKIIIIAILVLTVISCNKTNKDVSNESSVDNNEIIERNTIEYTIINRQTGLYETFDTEKREGH